MKDYLNFEGLSYFLSQLLTLFAKKEDIITNADIDDICNTELEYEDTLLDETTGSIYRLYVDNGKLNMMEVE